MLGKKKNKVKKILVISASAGSGHTISAIAVEQAFKELYPQSIDVTHVDVLDYTTKIMRAVYKDVYLYLAKNKPLTYGFFYKFTDREKFGSGLTDWIHTRKFRRYLKKNQYDLIISTHFLPSNIIARMKKKKRFRKLRKTPHMTILTDFGAHKIWLAPSDYYIVPDAVNKEYFIHRGIAGENVYDLGIPVRTVFAKTKNKKELQKKYGFDKTKKTILLLSGGFGVGPILDIVKNLDKVKTPHQTVVICGKNQDLYNDCLKLKDKMNFPLFPVGYTNDIDEYMKLSDIIITKPGGLTTAEALACNLPIVIVNPIIGQEDKNADRLLEEGCAIKITYLSIMYYYLDRLFKEKDKLEFMKNSITKLSKPDAAYNIARFSHKILFKR